MSGECDFGLIGLAVMGENLALNVESRGNKVAVYNRTTEKVVPPTPAYLLAAMNTLSEHSFVAP